VSASSPRRTVDVIDRRVALLFGAFIVMLALVVARAGYLGLFRSGALRAAAISQQVQTTPTPAARGEITDRDGVLLALSEPVDQIIADPYLINRSYKRPQMPASELAPLLGMTEEATLQGLTKPGTGYVKLGADVSAGNAQKIMALGINGISEVPTEHRSYPRGTEAGQLIGWIGAGGHGDGLEYLFNRKLAGVDGVRRSVLDAEGKPISVQTSKPMVPGKSLSLTISAPLQSEVEQVLAGVGQEYKPQGATAIVTDPQTDQVLALANWPAVNPNRVPSSAFSPVGGHVPAAEDQAVDMSYEPGSTFKAITVAGALQDGKVSPNTEFSVPAYLDPYGYKITDAEPHGNETLSVYQILQRSSNIGAVKIAATMGAQNFAYWINRFGFGTATGVALPGEGIGVVPRLGTSAWSGLSMFNLPFGQGLEITPMQMVQAYDAIANGGILRTPQVIDAIGGRRVREPYGKRIISAYVASQLRDMLRGVLADGGTASGAAIPGFDMAGKTGTASVVVNGKYSTKDYVASFIGMVPASDPKLVVAVVVNAPTTAIYGGSVAAPAFQKIVGWAVPHFGINPCPSPCPASAKQPAMPSTP
jgi:cell division protein FtsI (penicillin-binding protein 3)